MDNGGRSRRVVFHILLFLLVVTSTLLCLATQTARELVRVVENTQEASRVVTTRRSSLWSHSRDLPTLLLTRRGWFPRVCAVVRDGIRPVTGR